MQSVLRDMMVIEAERKKTIEQVDIKIVQMKFWDMSTSTG